MNEEDMEAVEPLAGEELERMLARYARVRLEPSQAQARRARAAVMEEAWRRRLDPHSLLRAPGGAAAGVVAGRERSIAPRRFPFTGWSPRRLGVAFTAATLAGLMLGSSVFAASRAGGPLYESRLALESLTLPADPAARVAAELTWADARLGEAVEAAFRHDDRAVGAALDAYDRAIDAISSANGAAADEALAAIQLHHAVLVQLATQVPSAATAGVDEALANSDRAIVRLGESGNGAGSSSGNNGKPQGNGFGADGGGNAAGGAGVGQDGGNAGGNGNGNANGADKGNTSGSGNANGAGRGGGPKPAAGSPAPTATAKPTPTATPKPNTGPQGTHGPAKTPKPHASTGPDEAPTPSE